MNSSNLKGTLFWIPTLILSLLTFLLLIWLEVRPEPTLHEAAAAGDLKQLQKIATANPELNALNDKGWTPLTCAVKAGQLSVVKLLLMAGADVNVRSRDGSAALHDAMEIDHLELITVLLDAGADPYVKDQNEESPLCLAIQRNGQGIELFLERGGVMDKAGEKTGGGYLFDAARSGCLPVLLQLLNDGAEVDSCSSAGITPLLYATHAGQLDAVRILIEQGADVNMVDRYGWAPLHHAVREERAGLLELLLENGADLEARDNDGRTPLFLAAQRGYVDAFAELLNAGADGDVKDNEERGVEYIARAEHQTEILELMSAYREKSERRAEEPPSAF